MFWYARHVLILFIFWPMNKQNKTKKNEPKTPEKYFVHNSGTPPSNLFQPAIYFRIFCAPTCLTNEGQVENICCGLLCTFAGSTSSQVKKRQSDLEERYLFSWVVDWLPRATSCACFSSIVCGFFRFLFLLISFLTLTITNIVTLVCFFLLACLL